ncbi:MAG: TraM recognition domain-containing protein [Cyanobacteria bacterium P01_F01_bin.150]
MEDAGKTTGGIIAGAQNLLLPFIQPDLMACFVGQTNAPTYINEKQILVFENDINRQEVLAPILAAIIHMVVLKNFAKERETGLLVALDEVPTITLPDLAKYPAEFRSKGCVTILGLQNMAQLAHAYGDKKADIIAANMSTKFIFNPSHQETAEQFSKYIGDTEVTVKNANQGQNFNVTGAGRSKGTSETIQIVPLMRPEEITRMKWDCVLINPAYGTATEGSIPWHIPKINIPKSQATAYAENRRIWANTLEPKLIEREKHRLGIETFAQLEQQMEAALNARIALAEQMLPMPTQEPNASGTPVVPF